MTTPNTKTEEARKGPALFVQDTNARPPCETRTHDVMLDNGGVKSYSFTLTEWVEMPEAHAAKFLRDTAFVVCREPDGRRIDPVRDARDSANGMASLDVNECIARYDEMTHDALIIRAQMQPGGEHFKKTTKKADLIDFLTSSADGAASHEAEGDTGSVNDAGGIGGEMSPAEVAALLGDDED